MYSCVGAVGDVFPSVTGTIRGYANSRIATRGLVKSRTGQVADWTTRGCRR